MVTNTKNMQKDRYMESSRAMDKGLVGGEGGKKLTRPQRDTFHLLMTTRRTLLEETKDRVSMESRVSMTMKAVKRGLKKRMGTVRTILTTMMRNHCQQEKLWMKKSMNQKTTMMNFFQQEKL